LKGNWFEELALKTATGVRYYPTPKDRTSTLLTKSRCIEHTEQELPQDYKSTTSVDIRDPRLHPQYKLQVMNNKGPRMRQIEEKIKAQVEAEFDTKKNAAYEESRHVAYSSTYGESFSKPGFKPFL
jgi:hypothetical protein